MIRLRKSLKKWWARKDSRKLINYLIVEGIFKTLKKLPSKLPYKVLVLVGWEGASIQRANGSVLLEVQESFL